MNINQKRKETDVQGRKEIKKERERERKKSMGRRGRTNNEMKEENERINRWKRTKRQNHFDEY